MVSQDFWWQFMFVSRHKNLCTKGVLWKRFLMFLFLAVALQESLPEFMPSARGLISPRGRDI